MKIIRSLQFKLFSLCKKQLDAHLKLFNKIPGFLRFYRLIYRFLKPKGFVLLRIQGNLMRIDTKDDILAPLLLAYGVHEKYETELFNKLVKPGMVVLDIGANIGYFSLIAARLVGENGRVYAFEPEPNNYNILISNIKANNFNHIVPMQKLVLDKCGKVKLFLDRINHGGHSICQGNIPIQKDGFLEVEAITIDGFFENLQNKRIDLMKIDVEGAEDLVIRGAEEAIRGNNNLKIIMEFWPAGLINSGTNPADLLRRIKIFNFKIKVIFGQSIIEESQINKIIETAKDKKVVTLFLEK